MTPLHITVDLDRAPWTDINADITGAVERMGLMRHGAPEGDPAVLLVVRSFDRENVVVATMTYRLFRMAAKVFAATPAGLLLEEED